MNTTQTDLACRLDAHTPEQRARHRALLTRILTEQLEAHEHMNGYTITLPAETAWIIELAEYISLERLCCPGLRLSLTCEANAGPLKLELSGTSGSALRATLEAAIA